MDFINAFKHYQSKLKERFNLDINYDDYLKNMVWIRTLPKEYSNKCVRYLINDMVHLYYVGKNFEYPITVYKLDRFNKGRILKLFNKHKNCFVKIVETECRSI